MSPGNADSPAVSTVIADLDAGITPAPSSLRDAVRALLGLLRQRAPGRSVEVRVPPFGAIQCVEGPRHTRGIPSNVVETDAITFILLTTGQLDWAEAANQGRLTASGARADLSAYLPCWPVPD